MINRIIAVMQQEYFITKRSLEVIFDLFIFSSITVIVFGFVAKYLAGSQNTTGAVYLIIGLVLWEIVRVGQYSVTVSVLWNVWSRNLSNMFVSPLSTAEYLAALMISSIIKCAVVLIIVGFIVFYITGFNILKIGFLNIILDFTNLIIFSWSMGIILTGLIFRFGTRIQAMAWGAVFLFQPLSASFFPITILPKPIQIISYYIPATHVFVAARKNFTNPQTDWSLFFLAIGLNIIYFATSCLIFYLFYRKSLETGQFARNEG